MFVGLVTFSKIINVGYVIEYGYDYQSSKYDYNYDYDYLKKVLSTISLITITIRIT